MKRISVVLIALLTLACVAETIVIVRRGTESPAVARERERFRDSSERRTTFCAAYLRRLMALPVRLANEKNVLGQQDAATELVVLSDSDFLQVCEADDQAELASLRATVTRCRTTRDFECLTGFAGKLLFKVPDPTHD